MKPSQGRRVLRFETLENREMLAITGVVPALAMIPSSGVNTSVAPVVLGDEMIYVQYNEEFGSDLWKTDGTEQGTQLLKTFPTRMYSGSQLILCGDSVYFTAGETTGEGIHGTELWKTDGTAEGTVMVKDIVPGQAGSNPENLIVLGDTLFFTAYDEEHGRELWKTDGTDEGTVLVKDIWPGSNGGCAWRSRFCVVGDTLFFSAQTFEGNFELWKTDGTEQGTVRIKDIRTGLVGSYPEQMVAVGNTLYFTADDGIHGTELWKSNGTAKGTVLVKDILPGNEGSVPSELRVFQDRVYFVASDGQHGNEFWVSDGTEQGTMFLCNIGTYGNSFVEFNGSLYFGANDGIHGAELWKTDGTREGTVLVHDIFSGERSSFPGNMLVFGDKLFFSADDGTHGTELWVSDGTGEGAVLFQDIQPGFNGSGPSVLTKLGDIFLFAASDDAGDRALHRSDGTESGTHRVIPVEKHPTALISNFDSLTVQEGCSILLSAEHSLDPLGEGLVYLWNFMDGKGFVESTSPEIWFTPTALNLRLDLDLVLYAADGGTGESENSIILPFLPLGPPRVQLKVRDAQGRESRVFETTIEMESVNLHYEIDQPSPEELIEKSTTHWTFRTTARPGRPIMGWNIDWGDGSPETRINGGPRNQVDLEHFYREAGWYTIKISTCDYYGQWSQPVSLSVFVQERSSQFLVQSVSESVEIAGLFAESFPEESDGNTCEISAPELGKVSDLRTFPEFGIPSPQEPLDAALIDLLFRKEEPMIDGSGDCFFPSERIFVGEGEWENPTGEKSTMDSVLLRTIDSGPLFEDLFF